MKTDVIIHDIPTVREGWIYLLWAQGTNRYKIGRSINPVFRHQAISSQSPYPLIMLNCFWTIDAVNDETFYHQRNHSSRVHGEWLEIDDKWLLEEAEIGRDKVSFMNCFWQDHDSSFFACVPSPSISSLFETSWKYLEAFLCDEELDLYARDLLMSLYRLAASRKDFIYIDSLIRNVIPEERTPSLQSRRDLIFGILIGGRLRLLDQQKILEEYPKDYRFFDHG